MNQWIKVTWKDTLLIMCIKDIEESVERWVFWNVPDTYMVYNDTCNILKKSLLSSIPKIEGTRLEYIDDEEASVYIMMEIC